MEHIKNSTSRDFRIRSENVATVVEQANTTVSSDSGSEEEAGSDAEQNDKNDDVSSL